ncbi:serine/threonine protein kinase, partial [Streptomyces sp. CLV115]
PATSPATPPRASITDVVPRRTLAIIAAVIVLAVLGTVLALTLGGGDENDPGKGGGNGDKSTSAGSSTATGGSADTDSGNGNGSGKGKDQDQNGSQGQGQGQDEGKGKDKTDKESDGSKGDKPKDTLPAGFKLVTNKRFHFSMVMPEKFRFDQPAGNNSGAIYNVSGGFPRIQVDYTDSPGGDAAAAWNTAKAAVAASSNGYRHLGIDKVQYKGYPTVADWQFERTQHGQRVRVINRGFKVDGKHGYAIMISCKADEWDSAECRAMRKTAFDTFKPID